MASNPHDKVRGQEIARETNDRSTLAGRRLGGVIVVVVVLVAAAVAAYSLVRLDPTGKRDGRSAKRFDLDLKDHLQISPDLIRFDQAAELVVSVEGPTAIAVGPDRIYVAGQRAVEMLDLTGRPIGKRIALDEPATCLAVAPKDTQEPGRLYVGAQKHVVTYGTDGTVLKRWAPLGEKSVLTAIAVGASDVFVADAGQSVVVRYDPDGKILGRIGESAPDRQGPSFVIPSPYFDLTIDSDETLWIVNPGARRIESFSYDGQLQTFWGRAGTGIADFFGCCNPSHLARLPDGRFVTSEKGIPRVKIYTDGGDFESVVAGPSELGVPATAIGDARSTEAQRVFDIAVSQSGDVLVLDSRNRSVRVFRPKPKQTET